MNDGVRLYVAEEKIEAVVEAIDRGLTEHAASMDQSFGKRSLTIAARDARGDLVGALNGMLHYRWLYVAGLWVDSARRGEGLGTRLMNAAEDVAWDKQCIGAHLNTFGFQARRFYEKRGYTVFGELTDSDPQRVRYYLRKMLDGDGSAQSGSLGSTSTSA